MKKATSSPLMWPEAWQRTPAAKRLPFADARKGMPLPAAVKRLKRVLEGLGAGQVIVSLNAEPRRLREAVTPQDPGAAVYFSLGSQRYVLACDRWQRAGDNVIALARHIRTVAASLEHLGIGLLAQAFAGYAGSPLPPDFSGTSRGWRVVLHIRSSEGVTVEHINARYRVLAKKLHPDQPTGSHAAMTELNLARAAALRELER
jgi:hypothetical protein